MQGTSACSSEESLSPWDAPHVEVVLLPEGRRPPGQLFWVTDDVLPDLHVALGIREGYDWERRGVLCTENISRLPF